MSLCACVPESAAMKLYVLSVYWKSLKTEASFRILHSSCICLEELDIANKSVRFSWKYLARAMLSY